MLARKLSRFTPLSPCDHHALDRLVGDDEAVAAGIDLLMEGGRPRGPFLLGQGMAMRYRAMRDGGRQIIAFLIPGDLCDLHGHLLRRSDHSVRTLVPSRVSAISRDGIAALQASHPRLAAAIGWNATQEEAMLRERIVSLGRRDARARLAFLLCELLWRHKAMGLADGARFHLPLTQNELADSLGLTPVHINRVLQEFRRRGLLVKDRRNLDLLDVDGLRDIAGFDPDYLHLDGASADVARRLDALDPQGVSRR